MSGLVPLPHAVLATAVDSTVAFFVVLTQNPKSYTSELKGSSSAKVVKPPVVSKLRSCVDAPQPAKGYCAWRTPDVFEIIMSRKVLVRTPVHGVLK